MRAGFLYLQTHRDHPGLIRVLKAEHPPALEFKPDDPVAIRYIARFNDLDAARMHFHNAMPRRLVDVNASLYRTTLPEAIANIETCELRHQRFWIDPDLSEDELQRITTHSERQGRRHRRNEIIWRIIGALALLGLLFNMLNDLY